MDNDKILNLANTVVDLKKQYQEKMKDLDSLLDIKKEFLEKLQELISATTAEVVELKKNEVIFKSQDKSVSRHNNSMKKLIMNILEKNTDGLSFKDITMKVKSAIENGEYKTSSDKIVNLVSQALNNLRKQSLIVANSSLENNRHVYALVKSEAA